MVGGKSAGRKFSLGNADRLGNTPEVADNAEVMVVMPGDGAVAHCSPADVSFKFETGSHQTLMLVWQCPPWRRVLIRKCRARRHEMGRV